MNLLHRYQRWTDRKRLKDASFSYLFEEDNTGELVCFDLETTSLDPKSAEILSIGAVKIRNQRVLASQRLHLLVKPTQEINRDSIRAHQLRNVDVENGLEPEEALRQLLTFIGSRPLVGYYLEFDVAVVNRYLKRWLGIRLPHPQTEVSAQYYDWKTRGGIDRYVDLSFDRILQDLDLPELPKHNPVNDSLMAALVYTKLTYQTKPAPHD
ncbi:MAG: 3'-5' exonuclease [Chromatiales bacterium]|nr:3'-5' exonuclease [Chromatiales bacterium]